MQTLAQDFNALVFGSSGGIGSALVDELAAMPRCSSVIGLSRQSQPGFDLTSPSAFARIADDLRNRHQTFDLIFDATGVLAVNGTGPEKSLTALDADVMAEAFAVNAIGPALLIKHFTPLLPDTGKCAFATLSARVGSIGDNHLGGWYAYRASKAALNQFVKTAAIEIARKRPEAVCLALHPGTVETPLSQAHARGRFTHSPAAAAARLLHTIDQATAEQSGSLLAYDGATIPW